MMTAVPMVVPSLAQPRVTPDVTMVPAAASTQTGGYTPAQIRAAYQFNDQGYTGAGQTIAIIEGSIDPTIASDVKAFDYEFGVQPLNLTIKNVGAGSSVDSHWAQETALDVEWAHAVAPLANILLVQADPNDLIAGVQYATSVPNVSVVSMSWGSPEQFCDTNYDQFFTTPGNHIPITFVASSGDNGAGVQWPAMSKNVVAVGGTSLTVYSSNGSYYSETGWSGSGGGVSVYEPAPTFQTSFQTYGMRTVPDVAYAGASNSAFWVYNSNDAGTQYSSQGWEETYGTSAGAPQWAALFALADQGRVAAGRQTLGNAVGDLYALPATDFHDVTTGSNGAHVAHAGYDLVTGRGSPIGIQVIVGLVNAIEPVKQIGQLPVAPIKPIGSIFAVSAMKALGSVQMAATISPPAKTVASFATGKATITMISSPTMAQSNLPAAGALPTASLLTSASVDEILWDTSRTGHDDFRLRSENAADDLLEELFETDPIGSPNLVRFEA